MCRDPAVFTGEGRPPDEDAEWDSPATIAAIHRVLEARHEVIPVEANNQAYLRLKAARPDVVFNVAEGCGGPARESLIPAMLELLEIPYTGADPLALGLCLHKAHAKEVLLAHALPTPPFVVAEGPLRRAPPFGFPAIVKPLHEGSSKGICNGSLVHNSSDLTRAIQRVTKLYGQSVIIEKYLPGREFTVALLGNGPELTVLPLVELNFDSLPSGSNPIYGYEAKWIWDVPESPINIFECPARVERGLEVQIEELCKEAFRVLGCRDWCRIDVRLDDRDRPSIIEVNPLPGILPRPEENSCFPKAARAAGMDYATLIERVLECACRRTGVPFAQEAVTPTV